MNRVVLENMQTKEKYFKVKLHKYSLQKNKGLSLKYLRTPFRNDCKKKKFLMKNPVFKLQTKYLKKKKPLQKRSFTGVFAFLFFCCN